MEVKELIDLQRADGVVRLLRQGLFLRGYDAGALMLEAVMGYQVHAVELKGAGQRVCYAGFPSAQLDRVIERVESAGGRLLRRTDSLVEIGGLAYVCGEQTVASYPLRQRRPPAAAAAGSLFAGPGEGSSGRAPGPRKAERLLSEAVRAFDLENATATQALLFVGELKRLAGAEVVLPGLGTGGR